MRSNRTPAQQEFDRIVDVGVEAFWAVHRRQSGIRSTTSVPAVKAAISAAIAELGELHGQEHEDVLCVALFERRHQ